AVLGSLLEAKLIPKKNKIHVGTRAGGYVRAYLEHAGEQESQLFSLSLEEALGPLDCPRYIIPRIVEHRRATWLSRLLPQVLGRYFQKKRRQLVMLHAVPAAMARNKKLAEIYTRHWNRHVSPGDDDYAMQGEGKAIVEQALRDSSTPFERLHQKEIFL
ncbi:MAG: DEAD/DEAH box helicase, partial [Planctomycetales bacterium]